MKQIFKVSLVIMGGVICTGSAVAQTKALVVTSSGSVGIGTDAPKNMLDVRGTVRALSGFCLEGHANYGYWNAAYLDNTGVSQNPVFYPHTDGELVLGKPDHRVQVNAAYIWCGNVTLSSDERIKENIHTIETPLTKITKLKGVQYDIRKSYISDTMESRRKVNRDMRKDNLGFLAQDLAKVFPELVQQQDSTGIYGVNYIGLIPVLVEALKEQQSQITALTVKEQSNAQLMLRIEQLEKQLAQCCPANTAPGKGKLKSSSVDAEATASTPSTSAGIVLYQNTPNPFSTSTEISMELPKEVVDAQLTVYNLAGEQRLSIPVADRGPATVRIEACQLKPGIYIYGIIADGQLAVSKQMVVTE